MQRTSPSSRSSAHRQSVDFEIQTDTLDRLLTALAVRVDALAVCEIKRGWRIAVDPVQLVTIHYILAGSGMITIGDGNPVEFGPGSVIIVPAGVSQIFGDTHSAASELKAADIRELRSDGFMKVTAGSGTPNIFCACGAITPVYGGVVGLHDFFRRPIIEDVSSSRAMGGIFEIMLAEIAEPRLGSQAIAGALMKQCLVLLLRQHLAKSGTASPLFAPLQDNRLTRVVTSVIEHPGEAYTVEQLAALAGMSRSAFSERFSACYGQSPMEFVQKIRLQHSAQLLASTTILIKVIAETVGYASRSYFTRAFRAEYGIDPMTYRAGCSLKDWLPRPEKPVSLLQSENADTYHDEQRCE